MKKYIVLLMLVGCCQKKDEVKTVKIPSEDTNSMSFFHDTGWTHVYSNSNGILVFDSSLSTKDNRVYVNPYGIYRDSEIIKEYYRIISDTNPHYKKEK